MKKVLVTGAGGTVGLQVIRFLLSEGKYEITALDLKIKQVYRRLKPFRKRINIVYGDVTDEALIDALVKDHDVVIHLAGVLPPLANVRDDLCKEIDFNGTKAIVDSIKNYNPECYLLYSSSTSVYGIQEDYKNISIKTDCIVDDYDYYSKYKLKCEKYIKSNLKNFSILRLAYILGDPGPEGLIYNVPLNCNMEVLSSEDAGYAFVCAIDYKRKLNKKTFNVSGGEKFRTTYRDYLVQVFSTYGLSLGFIASWLMAEKNYCGGYYTDGDELDNILHYRSKNLDVYYNTLLKYRYKLSRFLPRLLAKPFVLKYTKKK
ncbi:MAG: NAD-dependent epimerase/dehydratase family protein [Candidatus Coprovivens sp.]